MTSPPADAQPPAPAGRAPYPPAADPIEVAAMAVRIAQEHLRTTVVHGVRERGLSEVRAARLAGVDRSVVRRWRGKS